MRRHLGKQRPSVIVLLALVIAPLSVGLGSLQAAPILSPSPGGTLTIARGGDVISFDPYLATAPVARQVYDNVYDQLVVINPDLTLSPGLAERWQVVNDRTWRFYLRKGVKFHDGSEFTSDAVKFHFDRMLGYLPGSKPGRPAPFMDMIQEVRTSGPYVVTFRLGEPFGPLLNHLAPAWSGIPCPEAVKKLGDRYGESACGTGPFMFQEWRKGEQVTLVKNPQYWRGPAPLDRIIWRTIPDAKTRLLAFQRGEVEAVYQPPEHEVRTMFKDRNVTLHKDITLRTYYMGFNVQKEPFTDLRVRRAMSHAVNSLEIVEYVLEGVGRTPLGYFHPKVQGFSKTALVKFDQARAESLLDEAGWRKGPDGVRGKDGRKLEFTLLVSNQEPSEGRRVGEAIQARLATVGAQANIDYMEHATYLQRLPRGQHDMFLWSYGIATGDADFFLYTHFHSSQRPGRRYTFWSSPEIDTLLDTGRRKNDLKSRAEAYAKAITIIVDQALMQPLWHSEDVVVMKKNIKGFKLHPGEHLRFSGTWIEK